MDCKLSLNNTSQIRRRHMLCMLIDERDMRKEWFDSNQFARNSKRNSNCCFHITFDQLTKKVKLANKNTFITMDFSVEGVFSPFWMSFLIFFQLDPNAPPSTPSTTIFRLNNLNGVECGFLCGFKRFLLFEKKKIFFVLIQVPF